MMMPVRRVGGPRAAQSGVWETCYLDRNPERVDEAKIARGFDDGQRLEKGLLAITGV